MKIYDISWQFFSVRPECRALSEAYRGATEKKITRLDKIIFPSLDTILRKAQNHSGRTDREFIVINPKIKSEINEGLL